jgi:peptide deformylase
MLVEVVHRSSPDIGCGDINRWDISVAWHAMAYEIRTFGDPVLKSKAAPVTDVDGKLVRLVDDMFTTLYDSDSGIALAAPQIGVQKQIFVWDLGDDEPRSSSTPRSSSPTGSGSTTRGVCRSPGSTSRWCARRPC